MNNGTKSTPQISLITKTRTQNQGNQALSIAWRDYLSARYPEARLRMFERAPKHLKRYTVEALASEKNPVAAFDRIAQGLLRRMPANPGPDPSVWEVRHDPAQQQVVRFRRLRQALRLRSRIEALNLGASEYLNRLRHITQADLVVINPAGEFFCEALDSALPYLLETRCAQIAGCRTAFVNLSFEVADPTVIRLSDHVFAACDVLEFRDRESEAHLLANGGIAKPLVFPDGAIMTKLERTPERFGNDIALAINALQVGDYNLSEGWDGIIDELRNAGPVTLVSNEWTTDQPFWKKYLTLEGVSCDGEMLDCFDYARSLARYDVVVSSRLHTCVLGLIAGAAVVPVETGTFKLTGFFNEIGMTREPIRMGEDGWEVRLLRKIKSVAADPAARVSQQDTFISSAVASWHDGMDAVFPDDLLATKVK
jgi:polysaccharide pyruvyl transferase WcaK-like protein